MSLLTFIEQGNGFGLGHAYAFASTRIPDLKQISPTDLNRYDSLILRFAPAAIFPEQIEIFC